MNRMHLAKLVFDNSDLSEAEAVDFAIDNEVALIEVIGRVAGQYASVLNQLEMECSRFSS
jgi:hypothetical protein